MTTWRTASMVVAAFAISCAALTSGRAETAVAGVEAVNAIVGNTLVAGPTQDRLVFYFSPDHVVKTKSGNAAVENGRWSVRDEKLCFGPEQAGAAVVISGTHVKMMPEHGTDVLEGELVRGNPFNL